MTCGFLIFNGNLKNEKMIELNKFYKKAAENKNIKLELIENSSIFPIIDNGENYLKFDENLKEPNFILFLDKDLNLLRHLEFCGYKTFNSYNVLNICDDKILTYQYISQKLKIKSPKTLISPFIFNISKEDIQNESKFIKFLEEELSYPLIIKEARGSFGEQVYLIKNRCELKVKRRELGSTPHLYQEFIDTRYGKDLRMYTIGEKFVSATLRYNYNDFRSNVACGGYIERYNPDIKFIEMAEEISRAIKSDFLGIDILFGKDGEPIFCEANSNAHIKNASNLTGINIAELIFEHILTKISKV